MSRGCRRRSVRRASSVLGPCVAGTSAGKTVPARGAGIDHVLNLLGREWLSQTSRPGVVGSRNKFVAGRGREG